ncbi:MAG: peptidoglycan-binding protein [Nitrospirota bacterium]|jgi:N-acetylmuramoyl-L-alanine amidase
MPGEARRNRGPAGNGDYVVKDGDCLHSIAFHHGFLMETLWNLPENRELRQRRRDPSVLLPGDRVAIPAPRQRFETVATEQRHRFVRKGVPATLRLVVEHDDRPIADAPYHLTIDGIPFSGETDEQGLLELDIPPDARSGSLEIDGLTYELSFGMVEPEDEDKGAQVRLANLGFYEGAIDGVVGPLTRRALADFQARVGLEQTSELDDETLRLLLHRHDEEHEGLPDDADDASGTTDG